MSELGLYNRSLAKQLISFSGLLKGSKSATDIDGLIEYDNRFYIFIEVKKFGKELPYGQKLALERLGDDLSKVKPCLVIIAEHNENNPEEDIDLKNCLVRAFRLYSRWKEVETQIKVKDMVREFIRKNE